MHTEVVNIDLHVHSSHSDQPFSWFLRSAGSAECYTSPEMVYEIATRRGMSLVTLTDHDTINGALELRAKYDNTFLSEEISARFPEDGCIIHTIALDITEAQHVEIQRLRRNIYELVQYMTQERIPYFWCHPLSDVNHRLTESHIERCLLMFRALELRNGTRDQAHEDRLLALTQRLDPEQMVRWAEKHPQTPPLNLDGRYAFTGGSDDHGSIAIARAYTSFDGLATAANLRAALASFTTRSSGESGTGITLAHNCYGVTAGFLRRSGQLGIPANGGDAGATSLSLLRLLGDRKQRLEQAGGQISRDVLIEQGHHSDFQDELYHAVEAALVGGWRSVLGSLSGALSQGRMAEVGDNVADLAKSVLLELPYLLAHRWHVRDRNKAHALYGGLGLEQIHSRELKVAVVTDTIDEISGVATGLRRLHKEARQHSLHFELVAPGTAEHAHYDHDGIYRIPRVYQFQVPEYPQFTWAVPHLPPLMRYLSDQRIDLLQCSTPGPAGLVALLAGRLMGIPVIGQFHTDVAEYTLRLTGDPTVASLMRLLVGWFYRGMDQTLVPSSWVGELVHDLGVASDRIIKIPRGIDLELFRPDRRDPGILAEHGLDGSGPTLLYVGRISKEKSLDNLAHAFHLLSRKHPTARLLVVGDGPFAEELARMMPSDNVIFTGAITGERLAALYASCDVFVFPSETETFGNAVVEAQAAGLPVVVVDRGAAHENVRHGTTGMVVSSRNPLAMASALELLLENEELRHRMGRAARQFAEQRYDIGNALRGTFREYTRIVLGEPERPALGELPSAFTNQTHRADAV